MGLIIWYMMLQKVIKNSYLLFAPWKAKSKKTGKIIIYLASFSIYCITFLLLFFIVSKIFFPLPMYRLNPTTSTVIFDRNGKILRVFTAPDEMWRIPANIKDISPNLRMALINYEDKWFAYHLGVNPISIIRATITNLKAGKIVCGGSTITMQVARMMEPKPRTIKSKIIEMIRAVQLELSYSKDEILSFYFNMAPYGSNIVGSSAASYLYFNKDQKDLSLGEAALLAVIPSSPTILRPDAQIKGKNGELLIKQARNKVLERLLKNRKITQQQFNEAISESIPTKRHPFPFYAPQLTWKLKEMYHGINKIVSTIDRDLQILTRNILQKHLNILRKKGISNGAVVLMDTKTRNVLAMVASADFFDEKSSGQVNGAMAPRSPGSALKPFVYALAIDRGIVSVESIMSDVPVDYSGYRPENYDEKFRGAVTMKEALIHSLNVPAVNLSAKLGEDGVYEFLKEAGISTLTKPEEHYGLSLILGGCEVTLLDITNLYAGLANMGNFGPYELILESSNISSKISRFREPVPPHQDKNISRRLLREGTAYIITEILSEVERPDLPSCWESAVNLPKVAWKTGTSYGHKDAWSIGYSPKYTIGVWVGNFDGTGSPAIVGAETAGPILFDIFNALAGLENTPWYIKPSEVEEREVCSLSGMPLSQYCRHSKRELYIPGVSPNQQCTFHRAIAIDKETGTRLCPHCRIGRSYETKIFIVWPPEIATWLERNGISVDKLPPHYPECSQIVSGDGPIIHSPSADSEYIIRKNVDIEYQKILLEASVSNDSRNIFWFLDSKLIFNGSPTEKVFITPTPGKHKLACMDDEGRVTEMILKIK